MNFDFDSHLNLSSNQIGARPSKLTPTSSNLSQKVVRSSGHQAVKKPRLEIDKQVNMRNPTTSKLDTCSNSNRDDFYDSIWGDDFDTTALEKVDFDESLAFSQMPANSAVNIGTNIESTKLPTAPLCNSKLPPSQITCTIKPTTLRPMLNQGNFKTSLQNPCQSSSSHGVPLRRTASSDSSSSRQFSHNYTNNTIKQLPNRVSSYGNNKGQLENGYLLSDFEQIKKDLEKLKEELRNKNGEVNILRTKQASNQQEFNKQKKEYVDAIKQEVDKYNQLLKENQSLKSQLGVKEMEIETAERKMQLLSTKRLHPESPNNRSPRRLRRDGEVKSNQTQLGCRAYTLAFELLQQLVKPHLLEPAQPQASIVETVRSLKNPGLFSGSTDQTRHLLNEGCASSSKSVYATALSTLPLPEAARKQLAEVCCSLEPCALALLTPDLLAASSHQAHVIISQVLDTCQTILRNQLSQLISAAGPLNRHLERDREVQHSTKKLLMLSDNSNLLFSRELFSNEKGICTRRALTLVSLLVEISNLAAKSIVECYGDDQQSVKIQDVVTNELKPKNSTPTLCSILNTLKDVVIQIEAQRRTIMFEGVLAGAMSLVKSVLQTNMELSKECQQVIVDILRAVVLARPGSLVIHNILQALISATNYPFIMDSICTNSDTCILQVLCLLLYTVETPSKHILSDLFTSWVLILFYGERSSPHWLYSVPSQTKCKCRSLISRLTFNLLGEAICMYPSVPDGTRVKQTLQRLLTRGVLMVSTLLYHDEHFGANVDPPSVGFYELYLYSFNSSDVDLELIRPCRVILEILCKQESHRQPINDPEGNIEDLNMLLTAFTVNTNRSINSGNGLDYLDSC